MLVGPLLNRILYDDAVTRGLADPEARILVEWLVERVEDLPNTEPIAAKTFDNMCRRCRAISRFVHLWCHRRERGAAGQLAAAERFSWPLPDARIDPCELMQTILDWEANGR